MVRNPWGKKCNPAHYLLSFYTNTVISSLNITFSCGLVSSLTEKIGQPADTHPPASVSVCFAVVPSTMKDQLYKGQLLHLCARIHPFSSTRLYFLSNSLCLSHIIKFPRPAGSFPSENKHANSTLLSPYTETSLGPPSASSYYPISLLPFIIKLIKNCRYLLFKYSLIFPKSNENRFCFPTQ